MTTNRLLTAFGKYLREVKGIKENSIHVYLSQLKKHTTETQMKSSSNSAFKSACFHLNQFAHSDSVQAMFDEEDNQLQLPMTVETVQPDGHNWKMVVEDVQVLLAMDLPADAKITMIDTYLSQKKGE